jgi:hypothetical protein
VLPAAGLAASLHRRMELPQSLQDSLTHTYDLAIDYRVADFLITDATLLPQELRAGGADEQVLIEEGDPIGLGLYLDPAVLARLYENNLAAFLSVAEGVSHWLMLAWAAEHNRAVSLLELELQAEIDKFLLSWQILKRQTGRSPRELHHVLFERAVPDARLCADRYGLYLRAHQYGARYCKALAGRLTRSSPWEAAATCATLRRFYRLSVAGKIHAIEQCT